MAAGKPFLSTDTGCVRELPGGVVVDGEQELAEKLSALCAEPARRRKLGELGRKAVLEMFAMDRVREQQNKLLLELGCMNKETC